MPFGCLRRNLIYHTQVWSGKQFNYVFVLCTDFSFRLQEAPRCLFTYLIIPMMILYTYMFSLFRDLSGKCTSDIEKARALFRYLTEKQVHHRSWFLYYPEEGNKRGAPTQLLRGVEFGIETKALLFKRLCAYAGLHCDVVKGYSKSTEYLPGEEFVDTRYRYDHVQYEKVYQKKILFKYSSPPQLRYPQLPYFRSYAI